MPMSAEEFRAALERLELTQTGTAGADSLLGISERTSRRWAVDGPPDSVAMLLRLMMFFELTPDNVRKRFCDKPTRAKG